MLVTLSKVDIAKSQLDTAIKLYLDAHDLVSAITLAGAADEILGKLVRGQGELSALDKAVARLCAMYETAFSEASDPKRFIDLRNRARNEFKHVGVAPDVNVDLEIEAVSMLRRAIENYRKLDPIFRENFRSFEQEMLRRDRERRVA